MTALDRSPAARRRRPRPRLAPAPYGRVPLHFVVILPDGHLADPDDRPARQLVPAGSRVQSTRLVDGDLPAVPASPCDNYTPRPQPERRSARRSSTACSSRSRRRSSRSSSRPSPPTPSPGCSSPAANVLFVVVVGLLVVPLQTTFIPILQLFADFGLNGQFLAVWLAHTGLRPAVRDLPAPQLHGRAAAGGLRVGRDRRRQPRHVVLPPGPADERAGDRRVGDLPVPVRLERPARRADLHRAGQPARTMPLTIVVANLVNSLGGGW